MINFQDAVGKSSRELESLALQCSAVKQQVDTARTALESSIESTSASVVKNMHSAATQAARDYSSHACTFENLVASAANKDKSIEKEIARAFDGIDIAHTFNSTLNQPFRDELRMPAVTNYLSFPHFSQLLSSLSHLPSQEDYRKKVAATMRKECSKKGILKPDELLKNAGIIQGNRKAYEKTLHDLIDKLMPPIMADFRAQYEAPATQKGADSPLPNANERRIADNAAEFEL